MRGYPKPCRQEGGGTQQGEDPPIQPGSHSSHPLPKSGVPRRQKCTGQETFPSLRLEAVGQSLASISGGVQRRRVHGPPVPTQATRCGVSAAAFRGRSTAKPRLLCKAPGDGVGWQSSFGTAWVCFLISSTLFPLRKAAVSCCRARGGGAAAVLCGLDTKEPILLWFGMPGPLWLVDCTKSSFGDCTQRGRGHIPSRGWGCVVQLCAPCPSLLVPVLGSRWRIFKEQCVRKLSVTTARSRFPLFHLLFFFFTIALLLLIWENE